MFITACLAAVTVAVALSSLVIPECPSNVRVCTPDANRPDRGDNFSCCANCQWFRTLGGQTISAMQYQTTTGVVLHLPPTDEAYGVYKCVANDTGVVNYTLLFVPGEQGDCTNCFSTQICSSFSKIVMIITAAFDESLLNLNKEHQCELSLNGTAERFFEQNTSIEFDKDSFDYISKYRVGCGICEGNYFISYIIPRIILTNANSCSTHANNSNLITPTPTSTAYDSIMTTSIPTATSTENPPTSGSNTFVVIGPTIVAAGIIILIIISILICIFCYCKTQRASSHNSQPVLSPPSRDSTTVNSSTRHSDELQSELEVSATGNQSIMDIINKLNPEMEKYITIDELLPYLNRHQILTELDQQQLGPASKDPPIMKTRHLLSSLRSKGPDGEKGFVKALYQSSHVSGHKHLVQLLKDNDVTFGLTTEV